MKILILETTCDETAAAIVTDQAEVLGSVIASQEGLHRCFGGVVPEIASRAHLENILPVIDAALHRSNCTLREINAVAVANTPGLAGSLLIGLTAAKTLAFVLRKPLVAVNHLQAHVYACRVAFGPGVFPCLGLIVSGGHSSLYRCEGPLDFAFLGGTIDDAAGEAFDKVAAMLGLAYPGGPSIQKAALEGDPHRYRFPRPMLDDPGRMAFSFSGLKTAVRYRIAGPGKTDPGDIRLPEKDRRDLAASFQEAVVDCLVGKSLHALRHVGMRRLCIGGGVAANTRFRERMGEAARQHRFELFIAPLHLCTDNAVMGAIAIERLKAGLVESLELDIHPGLVRTGN